MGTTLDTPFVSLIAHDMRSPLSAIRGAVALLGDQHERLSAERRGELLAVVDDSTLQIDRVIQDLMGRLQSNRSMSTSRKSFAMWHAHSIPASRTRRDDRARR
jgi:K+-sensing histidine kinase KdpD